ncbi:MAG TPA: redoxin domain-containing protein [Actinomycetota bacterium]|nr:redoxin domain-containing protein [Actinomycetota bacterium]
MIVVPSEELEDYHKRSIAPRIALLAAGCIALVIALSIGLRPADRNAAGDPAPEFVLEHLDGSGMLSSAELRGKPVVLNLWASWCIPCREEAPALQAMWEKYKDRVVILGVNVRDREDAARRFADEFDLTYPLVRAEGRSLERALGAFGLPETYFIDHTWSYLGVATGPTPAAGDERGNVYLGGISEEELEANIEALLERLEEAQ